MIVGTEFIRIPSANEIGASNIEPNNDVSYVGTYQQLKQENNTTTFLLRAYIDNAGWRDVSSLFCKFQLMGQVVREKREDEYDAYKCGHGETLIGTVEYVVQHDEDGIFPHTPSTGFAYSRQFGYGEAKNGDELKADKIPLKPILKVTKVDEITINSAVISYEIVRGNNFDYVDYRLNNGEAILGKGKTEIEVKNLAPNTSYAIQVRGRSKDDKVIGDWSESVSFSTKDISRIIKTEDFILGQEEPAFEIKLSQIADNAYVNIENRAGEVISRTSVRMTENGKYIFRLKESDIDKIYNWFPTGGYGTIYYAIETVANGEYYKEKKPGTVFLTPIVQNVEVLESTITSATLRYDFSRSNNLEVIEYQVDGGAYQKEKISSTTQLIFLKDLPYIADKGHTFKMRGGREDGALMGKWFSITFQTSGIAKIINATDMIIERTRPKIQISRPKEGAIRAYLTIPGIEKNLGEYYFKENEDSHEFDIDDHLSEIYKVGEKVENLQLIYHLITERHGKIYNADPKVCRIIFGGQGPVFTNFEVEDINKETIPYTGTKAFILNYSDLQITINEKDLAVPQNGSEIKSYTAICGSARQNVEIDSETKKGIATFYKMNGNQVTIKVADNKGRTTTLVKQLDMVPYKEPEITYLSFDRKNLSGTAVQVHLKGTYTTDLRLKENLITVSYNVKGIGSGSISNLFITENNTIISKPDDGCNIPDKVFDTKHIYPITLTLSDAFSKKIFEGKIQKGTVIFSAKKGAGCALGGFYDPNVDKEVQEMTQVHNPLYTLDKVTAREGLDSEQSINIRNKKYSEIKNGYDINGFPVLRHDGSNTIVTSQQGGLIKLRTGNRVSAQKEVVIDDDGGLDAVTLKQNGTSIVNLIYPVGSIFISLNNSNPSIFWPGTKWASVAHGRALFGVGTLDGNTVTDSSNIKAGDKGGYAKVTLTEGQMPSHNHGGLTGDPSGAKDGSHQHSIISMATVSELQNNSPSLKASGFTEVDGAHNHKITSSGGGEPHENMPPYLGVYMWERIE